MPALRQKSLEYICWFKNLKKIEVAHGLKRGGVSERKHNAVVSTFNFYFFVAASQAKCERDELRQFPFRLLAWFVHLKQNEDFGTIDPSVTLEAMRAEKRQEVANVSAARRVCLLVRAERYCSGSDL